MYSSVIHVMVLSSLMWFVTATTTTSAPSSTTLPNPTDKLEKAVISSLLKIVDEKFDTLSSRISQMERALNGLQFFNIRQFRGMTNTVQSSAALTQAMHTKMGATSVETMALTTTVNRVSHDVLKLKESNSKIFQKLERAMLYINRNIEDRAYEIQTSVEKIDCAGSNAADLLKEAEAEVEPEVKQEFTQRPESILNCTVDMRRIEDRIDTKFNQLRNQSHFQYEKLRNQSEVQFNKLKHLTLTQHQDISKKTDAHFNKLKLQSDLQYNNLKNQSHFHYDSLKVQSVSQFQQLSNLSLSRSSTSRQRGVIVDNERLYIAISNMTSHVVQSVSFIRHTDSMLEQIISNTETLALEQEQIRKDMTNVVRQEANKSSSSITGSGTNIAQESIQQTGNASHVTGCSVPDSVLLDIAKFSKNGSQLLEILTELAQMSQGSLASSMIEFQDELSRLEEVRQKLNSETKLSPAFSAGDYHLAMQKILNTTKGTLKMVEAMAPNTGWIPHIFHNIQFIEGQLNRSISVTTRFLSEIRGLKVQLARPDPNAHAQGGLPNTVPNGVDGERRGQGTMATKDVLNYIYDTNVKLKRIMPALTRLIAEPEPLITLVSGRKENEGRVEIFHKGQWGALCDSRLGHVEASGICRNLGYAGGIAARRGQFGAGTGASWAFNLTCLRSFQCTVVTSQNEDKACGRHGEFGVICDHMLRIVALEGVNEINTGLLQVHHKSRWRPVCSHGFGRNEAQVACRQLGFNAGWMRDARGRTRGIGSVWLTNVSCRGTETSLHMCRHNKIGERSCPGLKPAAVTCE